LLVIKKWHMLYITWWRDIKSNMNQTPNKSRIIVVEKRDVV
jgi:hypothetical protein